MTRIVTGVDGSDAARAALAWAVELARSEERQLDVVHVYEPAVTGGTHALPQLMAPTDIDALVEWDREEAEEITRLQRQHAEALIKAALQHVDTDGVDIKPVILAERRPARVFIDLSKDHDVEQIVIGTRGGGGFGGLRLGSVATQCAAHAACPVTLVPPADSR